MYKVVCTSSLWINKTVNQHPIWMVVTILSFTRATVNFVSFHLELLIVYSDTTVIYHCYLFIIAAFYFQSFCLQFKLVFKNPLLENKLVGCIKDHKNIEAFWPGNLTEIYSMEVIQKKERAAYIYFSITCDGKKGKFIACGGSKLWWHCRREYMLKIKIVKAA